MYEWKEIYLNHVVLGLRRRECTYYTVEVAVDSTDEEPSTSNADITKVWSKSSLNYPCPLESHTHEMAECKEWLGMRLRIRWESTKQRMICYMCLKPKYVCKNRQCRI